MKIEGKRVCEVCGAALNEDIEFCPVCALQGALPPEKTESLSAISSELHFEHYQVLKNEDGTPLELGVLRFSHIRLLDNVYTNV